MQNSVCAHTNHSHAKVVNKNSEARVQRETRSGDCVLCITLHSHIRFLKSLRSTASSILSHFHTHCSSVESGDSSCQEVDLLPSIRFFSLLSRP